MGVRKPMALHTGHHTKAELETMKKENDAATGSRNCFTGSPPKELIDADARKEWKRITAILEPLQIVGDIDLYALVGYCNSRSLYQKTTKELASQPSVIETEKGPVKNPLIAIQNLYADQMMKFASKAGLAISTRLQAGALKVQNPEPDEITQRFGDF